LRRGAWHRFQLRGDVSRCLAQERSDQVRVAISVSTSATVVRAPRPWIIHVTPAERRISTCDRSRWSSTMPAWTAMSKLSSEPRWATTTSTIDRKPSRSTSIGNRPSNLAARRTGRLAEPRAANHSGIRGVRSGVGSIVTASAKKCLPSWVTSSPDQNRQSSSTPSSSRSARTTASVVSPNLDSSPPESTPRPRPKTRRPPLNRSSVAASRANFWGRRRVSGVTIGPTVTRSVADAMAVNAIQVSAISGGSATGRRMWSQRNTPSHPVSSALRARSAKAEMSARCPNGGSDSACFTATTILGDTRNGPLSRNRPRLFEWRVWSSGLSVFVGSVGSGAAALGLAAAAVPLQSRSWSRPGLGRLKGSVECNEL